jgi:excisionase family DNA binding protein
MEAQQMTAEPTDTPTTEGPRFLSVAAVARILGVSEVTLYRAIHAGEFPAVRIRGRLIVPAKAIQALADAAVADHSLVDTSGRSPQADVAGGGWS